MKANAKPKTDAIRRAVVKVGSNVLTAEAGLNINAIQSISSQICRLLDQGIQIILVSSGAMASGMKKMAFSRRPDAIPKRQAISAIGQADLIREWEKAFERFGYKVAQILLTSEDLASRKRYLNARNTMNTLLEWRVVPIINENDTVMVEEIKLGDNDNLAAMLTNLLGAELMINLTNVDGILDADPRQKPDAKLIPVVEIVDAELLNAASGQPGAVGLGGILSKVRAADKVARCGAHTIVANGLRENILDRLAAGEDLGTLFLPRSTRLTSRKHWIAFAAAAGGEVVVDEGAVRPLVERGKSLLAAGVREVRGDFNPGSAVKVLGPGDCILGVGLSNYSSSDLRSVMGLRSDQIVKRLQRDQADEVIHRDNLVVFDLDEEESVACLLNN